MFTNINVWSVPLFKIMYHMMKIETIFEDDFVLSSIVKTDLLSISINSKTTSPGSLLGRK